MEKVEGLTEMVSTLSVDNTKEIATECLSKSTSAGVVYEVLMKIVQNITEQIQIPEQGNQVQLQLDCAKRIASLLRKRSQREGFLRYYYFGMFQADLDRLQIEFTNQQSIAIRQSVASRKHFARIMQVLYSQEFVQQSILASQLNIEKANLSREMQKLIDVGFVEQRKCGKYKIYNLSAIGRSYYDKNLLLQNQLNIISPWQSIVCIKVSPPEGEHFYESYKPLPFDAKQNNLLYDMNKSQNSLTAKQKFAMENCI